MLLNGVIGRYLKGMGILPIKGCLFCQNVISSSISQSCTDWQVIEDSGFLLVSRNLKILLLPAVRRVCVRLTEDSDSLGQESSSVCDIVRVGHELEEQI